MEKQWKVIKGFEDYKVSEYGEVFSLKGSKLLKPRYTKDGYVYYRLSKSGGIQKDFRSHRLVAYAWLPNPNNLETVNHIDGVKTNNHYSNLEWMNRSNQLQHAYDLGLKKPMRGLAHSVAKATKEQVIYIRDCYDNHEGSWYGFYAKLSRETGLSQTLVTRIAKRQTYFDI